MKNFAMVPLALAMIGVLGTARPALSQVEPPRLEAGQMLRITWELLPVRTVARFQQFRADTLVATRRADGPLAIPLSRIERLEAGRQDHGLGARAGGLVGAVALTLAIAVSTHNRGLLDCHGCPFTENLKVSAIIGVPAGGLLGALLGGAIGATRWEPVPGWSGDTPRES